MRFDDSRMPVFEQHATSFRIVAGGVNRVFFSEKYWLIVDCSVMQTPNSAQNPFFTLLGLIVGLACIELELMIHRSVDINSETE